MDTEVRQTISDFEDAASGEDRVALLKQLSSFVKHKSLSESGVVAIVNLIGAAVEQEDAVRQAALSLLSYTVRRMQMQGQIGSPKIALAIRHVFSCSVCGARADFFTVSSQSGSTPTANC